MSLTAIALTAVTLLLIALVGCVVTVIYLRTRPGLRRRGEVPGYCGEKRRHTDGAGSDSLNDDTQ